MAIENISVMKLRDLLLATVPPDPDDQTVLTLQERVLDAMARHECRGVVLDISTVHTMDSFFCANHRRNRRHGGIDGWAHSVDGHARERGHHRDTAGLDDGQGLDRARCRQGVRPFVRSTSEVRSPMNDRQKGQLRIASEGDIVAARRFVRDAAAGLGFGITDVTRIVTAASELTLERLPVRRFGRDVLAISDGRQACRSGDFL